MMLAGLGSSGHRRHGAGVALAVSLCTRAGIRSRSQSVHAGSSNDWCRDGLPTITRLL